MFNPFARNKRWPIAIDIGADSVKLLQLTGGPSDAVRACGIYRIGATQTDAVRKRQEMIDGVRQLLRTRGFAGRQAVSCLSAGQLHVKNIRLPKMPPADMDQAIRWEAKERFGFEVARDRLNYLSAGEVRSGDDTCEELILMAVTDEAVQDHVELVSQMGLELLHVDAEPVALFRAYDRLLRRPDDLEAVSVIIDLGRSATRVVVARGEQIVFVKNIDMGGSHLNESVARKFNLSYQEAVELRLRTMGIASADSAESTPPAKAKAGESTQQRESLEWSIRDAVRAQVEALAREVSLCLRYCTVTFRGLRPARAALCGGEAYDRTLTGMLGEQLGIECRLENPLAGMDIQRVDLAADKRGLFSEWALCTGLALGWSAGAQQSGRVTYAQNRLSA